MLYIYPFLFLDSFFIQTITKYSVEFPVLCSRPLLVLYFIYSNVCMSVLVSQFIPSLCLPCASRRFVVCICLYFILILILAKAPEEPGGQNSQPRSGFLSLSVVNILGRIILCFGGLFYVPQDVQGHPQHHLLNASSTPPLPPVITVKNVFRYCQIFTLQGHL